MRSMKINREWDFGLGQVELWNRLQGIWGDRKVNLPHDYMIESDVYADAPSGPASGYYNAGVAHYAKEIDIPADWENDQVFLRFDGAMMNATVEVNGNLACLEHYGYAPFETDITRMVYPGQKNRIVITVNPSMQPNSRWFSGAGLFRGVELVHTKATTDRIGRIFFELISTSASAKDAKQITASVISSPNTFSFS